MDAEECGAGVAARKAAFGARQFPGFGAAPHLPAGIFSPPAGRRKLAAILPLPLFPFAGTCATPARPAGTFSPMNGGEIA